MGEIYYRRFNSATRHPRLLKPSTGLDVNLNFILAYLPRGVDDLFLIATVYKSVRLVFSFPADAGRHARRRPPRRDPKMDRKRSKYEDYA